MDKLLMCRICLIKDVRLHCLVNTHLQEIYEFMSGNLLETKDTRPIHACYMCCARLHNCLWMRTACLHSEEMFSHLLENESWEVTSSQTINMLQISSVLNINVDPVVHRELKIDPSPMTDEQLYEEHVGDLQDNIIDQENYTQFIKQEDMKSELISENEELDCSIQSIKVEINSASDSFLEHGTPESYISEYNQSISSVDRKDILGGKTVKIMLHRMDLNSFSKPATVTEHLNPTDLEYSSQCNNLNYTEDVEMSNPNICEEYKQIVHTSSEIHRDSFKDMRTDTGDTTYECSLNEKSFRKKGMLNADIRHTQTSGKPYKNDICGKSFIQKSKQIPSHTGEKQFRCNTCDKCFYNSSSLRRHIRTHNGEIPYKCVTCNKGFHDIHNLTIHNRVHNGEKPCRCPTCDKCFYTNSSLNRHKRTHTGGKSFKCNICGKYFSLNRYLLGHIRIHTTEKPYKCNICRKGFSLKKYLTEHIRTHIDDKPYKCDICGKDFERKSYLSEHMRTHTSDRPYKCDTCGKSYIRKKYLSEHIHVFHIRAGKKPHKCDICGKGFIKKRYLSEHIRTHTGDRPYKCDICGNSYIRKKDLSQHIHIFHIRAGEKLHKCDTCGKGFNSKRYLSDHVLTHTGDKPYKCDTCGKGFILKKYLPMHIRTHTGIKPYKCDACGKCFSEKRNLYAHIFSKICK